MCLSYSVKSICYIWFLRGYKPDIFPPLSVTLSPFPHAASPLPLLHFLSGHFSFTINLLSPVHYGFSSFSVLIPCSRVILYVRTGQVSKPVLMSLTQKHAFTCIRKHGPDANKHYAWYTNTFSQVHTKCALTPTHLHASRACQRVKYVSLPVNDQGVQ